MPNIQPKESSNVVRRIANCSIRPEIDAVMNNPGFRASITDYSTVAFSMEGFFGRRLLARVKLPIHSRRGRNPPVRADVKQE